MPNEPSLSEVHADLVGRLEQDKRLRSVETALATQAEAVKNLEVYLPRMEDRMTAEIRATKVNWWPVIGSLSAVVGVCTTLAVIFTR